MSSVHHILDAKEEFFPENIRTGSIPRFPGLKSKRLSVNDPNVRNMTGEEKLCCTSKVWIRFFFV